MKISTVSQVTIQLKTEIAILILFMQRGFLHLPKLCLDTISV